MPHLSHNFSPTPPRESHKLTLCSRLQGGVSNVGGTTTMSTTLIHNNTATEGMGANLDPQSGLLYYSLPTPPGYWLPNAFCQVYRQACPTYDPGDKCKDSREACALRSGNHANNYQPTVDGHQCQKPLFNQPCDWNVSACEEETDA